MARVAPRIRGVAAPTWEHSDYIEETTLDARILKLRQHIKEVSDFLKQPDIGVGSRNRTTKNLENYLSELKAELRGYERDRGFDGGGHAVTIGNFRGVY